LDQAESGVGNYMIQINHAGGSLEQPIQFHDNARPPLNKHLHFTFGYVKLKNE